MDIEDITCFTCECHNKVVEILDIFIKTQSEMLETITMKLLKNSKKSGRSLCFWNRTFPYGRREFYARAGGLVCIQLIAPMSI